MDRGALGQALDHIVEEFLDGAPPAQIQTLIERLKAAAPEAADDIIPDLTTLIEGVDPRSVPEFLETVQPSATAAPAASTAPAAPAASTASTESVGPPAPAPQAPAAPQAPQAPQAPEAPAARPTRQHSAVMGNVLRGKLGTYKRAELIGLGRQFKNSTAEDFAELILDHIGSTKSDTKNYKHALALLEGAADESKDIGLVEDTFRILRDRDDNKALAKLQGDTWAAVNKHEIPSGETKILAAGGGGDEGFDAAANRAVGDGPSAPTVKPSRTFEAGSDRANFKRIANALSPRNLTNTDIEDAFKLVSKGGGLSDDAAWRVFLKTLKIDEVVDEQAAGWIDEVLDPDLLPEERAKSAHNLEKYFSDKLGKDARKRLQMRLPAQEGLQEIGETLRFRASVDDKLGLEAILGSTTTTKKLYKYIVRNPQQFGGVQQAKALAAGLHTMFSKEGKLDDKILVVDQELLDTVESHRKGIAERAAAQSGARAAEDAHLGIGPKPEVKPEPEGILGKAKQMGGDLVDKAKESGKGMQGWKGFLKGTGIGLLMDLLFEAQAHFAHKDRLAELDFQGEMAPQLAEMELMSDVLNEADQRRLMRLAQIDPNYQQYLPQDPIPTRAQQDLFSFGGNTDPELLGQYGSQGAPTPADAAFRQQALSPEVLQLLLNQGGAGPQ